MASHETLFSCFGKWIHTTSIVNHFPYVFPIKLPICVTAECFMWSGSLIQLSLSFDSVKLAQSWETTEEADEARWSEPRLLPLVSPGPRRLSAICRRKFSARRAMSTSTRTTCSSSQRNTGKVMEQSNHGQQQQQLCFKCPVCRIKHGGRNWI